MASIIFNNKDSFKELGLKIENIADLPSANANYEIIEVPGRDGTLNIFNRYLDGEIPFNFVFKANEKAFIEKKIKISQWLNSKNNILIYTHAPGIYFKVNKVNISEFKTTSKIVRRFTAKFTIHPRIYLLEGSEIVKITSATSLYNGKATEESNPYIKIYGNGDINLYINNQTLVLKGVESYIEVDSELVNCYKTVNGVMVNQNDKIYSSFPVLQVGENNISWTGAVTKIELIPRWCCLV